MDSHLQQLAQIINESNKILIFTGAGISTESGISDYRSKGGLWKRFVPVTIQEFMASEDKRQEYWQTKIELYESFDKVKPNDGHFAIVELEKMGKVIGVVTQNIDGLHEIAGTSKENIVEIHGNNRQTVCLSCAEITTWQYLYKRLKEEDESPRCESCSGLLKPNTISFGQSLDAHTLERSIALGRECDCVLALGSTLVVEPAASIPRMAKENGARLVIITMSETPLDSIADLKINDSIGATMKAGLDIIKGAVKNSMKRK